MSRAFAVAVAAIGLLSGMDAMIKAQAATYPTLQIALLRFLFGSLAILATSAVARPPKPSLATIVANSWRAILSVVTALTFFFALGRLPLAETLALSLLSPCFTALLGSVLLGERVGRRIVVALGVGFSGMLVIVAPNVENANVSEARLEGIAAVLIATLAYSLSLVLLRSRATRDHPMTIVAVQNVGSAIILGAVLPFAPEGMWTPPAGFDLLSFGAIGVLGVAGHLLITKAYAMAPAAAMAAADYTALIFGAMFGFLFFSETPAWTTVAGAILIVVSSTAAMRRPRLSATFPAPRSAT